MASLFFERLESLLKYSSGEPETEAGAISERYFGHALLAAVELDEIAAVSSEKSANLVRLCYALAQRRITDEFRFGEKHGDEEIIRYFKAILFTKSRETSLAMFFDSEDRALGCECLGEGTVNFIAVAPRRVLELAIKKKAAYVILAHNHPGGVARPSIEDIEATRMISDLFRSSGRRVKAHYIFSGDHHGEITANEYE